MNIWLFDIDGVLVRAGGYRAAMRATINHFSNRMGMGERAPDDDDIEFFEACGLINEWDSVPICVAWLLCETLRQSPHLEIGASFDSALAALQNAGAHDASIGYRPFVRRIADNRGQGEAPSRTALRLLGADIVQLPLAESQLKALDAILAVLLEDADNVLTCPTTFVFQHFSLGSHLFARTFNLPPAFDSESLLTQYDQPQLTPEWHDRVLTWINQRELYATIFTARPSAPPRDMPLPTAQTGEGQSPRPIPYGAYAPEAELAVEMVGLTNLPLIGYGRLQWLGLQIGREPEELVKPSPLQALAAIGAAVSGLEVESLLAAHQLVSSGRLAGPLAELAGATVDVSVFEDTFGGIRAVREAAGLLSESGVQATAHAYGVAASEEKLQVMARLGAPAYRTFSLALEAACRESGLGN